MKLITAAEMGNLDRMTAEQYFLPSLILMENAGLAVVHAIRQELGPDLAGKRIWIFAGKGNNGGDGLVVARHLINAGAEVKIFLLARPEDLRGDAEVNYRVLRAMQATFYPVLEEKDVQRADIALLYADLIVDAIYGTGFKGAALGVPARVIELVNQTGKPVVAVDLPSGLEADTGKVNGPCVRATRTVTLALPKLGLVLEPGAGYVGQLTVADISIPCALVTSQPLMRELLTHSWCASRLPQRLPAGHKGDYGHVLVVGGSPGMGGAAVMAATAALRAGAGLVTLGVPAPLHQAVQLRALEVMSRPLPANGEGCLSREAVDDILTFKRASVLALGPGLSLHADSAVMVRELLPRLDCPAVIDADALNALSGHSEILPSLKQPAILTPHPGEMSRLLGVPVARVQEDRLAVAQAAAQQWQVTVVLKGARTVIATPKGHIYVNPTGNPGMATGGSGDVLTGIIAALLAQGLPAEEAAACGVYLHGLAGDLAGQDLGMAGLTATSLIEYLPLAFKEVAAAREG
ncbi:MAG: NAD(P)H-hydrate dehydratase [Clostridia bacterium]|nr:MAG: NAD(P)H-hydrate dehydratase [Clostridia bacterium]